MAQTPVSTCAATACSFNNGGCTVAMTMGERGCATFAKLDARRSVAANGLVGACQRLECVHNSDLVCTAASIDVTADAACAAFQAR